MGTLGGPGALSLYALTSARSGERKSACDAPLMAALREHEKEQAKAQRNDMESWTNAQALWKGERDRILLEARKAKGEKRTAAQAPGGDLGHITGTASKAAEQAARIAGVLTLWADLDAQDVQAETMADAITLAQFHLSEASRLASAATISGEIDKAEALRMWLLEN